MIHPLTVQAERLADKPAVVEDRPDGPTLTWSYAELDRQANRLAHAFRALGLAPGGVDPLPWTMSSWRVCVDMRPGDGHRVY
jgi:non-ribosomal peptide synthetase component E (peptide arylation enzyme)